MRSAASRAPARFLAAGPSSSSARAPVAYIPPLGLLPPPPLRCRLSSQFFGRQRKFSSRTGKPQPGARGKSGQHLTMAATSPAPLVGPQLTIALLPWPSLSSLSPSASIALPGGGGANSTDKAVSFLGRVSPAGVLGVGPGPGPNPVARTIRFATNSAPLES